MRTRDAILARLVLITVPSFIVGYLWWHEYQIHHQLSASEIWRLMTALQDKDDVTRISAARELSIYAWTYPEVRTALVAAVHHNDFSVMIGACDYLAHRANLDDREERMLVEALDNPRNKIVTLMAEAYKNEGTSQMMNAASEWALGHGYEWSASAAKPKPWER